MGRSARTDATGMEINNITRKWVDKEIECNMEDYIRFVEEKLCKQVSCRVISSAEDRRRLIIFVSFSTMSCRILRRKVFN